jgi:ATP-binding cassette subfamily B protein
MEIEQFENDSDETAMNADDVREYYENRLVSVSLKNASFTYYPAVENAGNLTKDNMPVVLNNIDFDIHKGEYVAFTGHSGCGKSTVLKLLMCIYKLDGGERILMGTDSKTELTPKWRRLFAYVPQGNQLMSGTIREVVAFADMHKMNDDGKIAQALKIACADEFVYELENGVDTLLGERGAGLSEGQMQRLAIARAIFSDCPILLLDEATSALDDMTEKQLLNNLKSMTDKTVIIVTHRPAALEICDKIFRFTENGIEQI